MFLFSVCVTRFQMPQSELFFSKRAIFMTRDGVPHLILRVGNLRCNMIFHPEVRLTLLRRKRTREGESYIAMQLLDVDPPATLAGCISIVHAIDEASALGECLDTVPRGGARDGRLSIKEGVLATMSICVTIVAGDSTYQSDVTGIKRYGPAPHTGDRV